MDPDVYSLTHKHTATASAVKFAPAIFSRFLVLFLCLILISRLTFASREYFLI